MSGADEDERRVRVRGERVHATEVLGGRASVIRGARDDDALAKAFAKCAFESGRLVGAPHAEPLVVLRNGDAHRRAHAALAEQGAQGRLHDSIARLLTSFRTPQDGAGPMV